MRLPQWTKLSSRLTPILKSRRCGFSLPMGVVFAALALVPAILVVEPAQGQTFSVVYNFLGGSDGKLPGDRLAHDPDGTLYGITQAGGAHKNGTVFKLDSTGAETILYSFTGKADGGSPQGGLFRDSDGSLFGTTTSGGDLSCPISTTGCGTIFKLDTNNVLSVLHTFKEGSDGAHPSNTLVSVNGELYGTAFDSTSACGCGLIYKVTKTGKFSVVYAFTGGLDGGDPEDLVRDANGNLYGAALTAGSGHFGTVFKLDAGGKITVLYSFTGGSDGGTPEGRLLVDVNGIIHGTTFNGGDSACNCGVVYRLDTNGRESVLHTFRNWPRGNNPFLGLLDVNGTFYGTTYGGGVSSCKPAIHGCGVFFKIANTGQYSVIHTFTGGTDGGFFLSQLILGEDGNIYGTAASGGTSTGEGTCKAGCGVVFKYTP